MKKVSLACFITGFVLIVCAIGMLWFGLVNIDAIRTTYTAHNFFTYSEYVQSNLGFGMVITGGFVFLGGILTLFMGLYARSQCCCCCGEVEEKDEVKSIEAPKTEE